MNDDLLKAARELFPNLSLAEERMLCAVRGERAICGSNGDDANPANNPQTGKQWDKTRRIRADLVEWLCKNAAAHGRSASDGIHVYGAKIEGVLNLSYAEIHLPFCFERCWFEDEIWLKNAKIPSLNLFGCWTRRILADGLQVANNVGLRDGFHITGQVLFRDANIGGGFMAVGATFEYEPSETSSTNSINSLGCDRMKVNGSMFLHRSSFKGEVGLAGAFIGSNLECDGGIFENPFCNQDGSRYAIRADRIMVNGGMFLRQHFSSKGSVRLINAKIGTLDCTEATIEGDGKNGFNAEAATIGHAVFNNFVIQEGGVELRGLAADDVSFRGAKLTTADLRYAIIRRALRIKQIKEVHQTLWDMRNASVGSLDDDEESWPQPGRLFIDGFTYQGFGGVSVGRHGEFSEAPLDFKLRQKWIELDTSRPRRPHAYRQLANAYLRMGDTLQVREALYSLEELLHLKMIQESSKSYRRALHWIWRQLLRWTIGYGYKLWLSALWLALLLIVGGCFSHWGYFAHVIAPTDKDAYMFFAQHGYPPNGYPPFSMTMFTIENSLPAINFAMSDHWAADGWLRYWFMCERIAGWFLSIFFLAGVTGLAKSDK